jgi:hypothetical protein
VESNWVHSALRPPIGLLCHPRVIMMMEKLVEWLAGETEVLGENLPQCRFVHHKPHMLPGCEPGPPRWEASDKPLELRHCQYKQLNPMFLFGPMSAILGGVNVFVFRAVHGCWCDYITFRCVSDVMYITWYHWYIVAAGCLNTILWIIGWHDRSQWPRGLRHELARTLGSWVWNPLKAWMSVCVYSVFVLFFV